MTTPSPTAGGSGSSSSAASSPSNASTSTTSTSVSSVKPEHVVRISEWGPLPQGASSIIRGPDPRGSPAWGRRGTLGGDSIHESAPTASHTQGRRRWSTASAGALGVSVPPPALHSEASEPRRAYSRPWVSKKKKKKKKRGNKSSGKGKGKQQEPEERQDGSSDDLARLVASTLLSATAVEHVSRMQGGVDAVCDDVREELESYVNDEEDGDAEAGGDAQDDAQGDECDDDGEFESDEDDEVELDEHGLQAAIGELLGDGVVMREQHVQRLTELMMERQVNAMTLVPGLEALFDVCEMDSQLSRLTASVRAAVDVVADADALVEEDRQGTGADADDVSEDPLQRFKLQGGQRTDKLLRCQHACDAALEAVHKAMDDVSMDDDSDDDADGDAGDPSNTDAAESLSGMAALFTSCEANVRRLNECARTSKECWDKLEAALLAEVQLEEVLQQQLTDANLDSSKQSYEAQLSRAAARAKKIASRLDEQKQAAAFETELLARQAQFLARLEERRERLRSIATRQTSLEARVRELRASYGAASDRKQLRVELRRALLDLVEVRAARCEALNQLSAMERPEADAVMREALQTELKKLDAAVSSAFIDVRSVRPMCIAADFEVVRRLSDCSWVVHRKQDEQHLLVVKAKTNAAQLLGRSVVVGCCVRPQEELCACCEEHDDRDVFAVRPFVPGLNLSESRPSSAKDQLALLISLLDALERHGPHGSLSVENVIVGQPPSDPTVTLTDAAMHDPADADDTTAIQSDRAFLAVILDTIMAEHTELQDELAEARALLGPEHSLGDLRRAIEQASSKS